MKPIPKALNPLVKFLLKEANRQGIPDREVIRQAGVGNGSFNNWKNGKDPSLSNYEACLGVLGYRLTIMKFEEVALSEPAPHQ